MRSTPYFLSIETTVLPHLSQRFSANGSMVYMGDQQQFLAAIVLQTTTCKGGTVDPFTFDSRADVNLVAAGLLGGETTFDCRWHRPISPLSSSHDLYLSGVNEAFVPWDTVETYLTRELAQ
ncbi:uncharacterized protein ARMOST_20046 [Armillaria ostoyae]|uniref:Uncharacterized protein n=1 Tax=Armillaria ostoyae TaxID=47428 RepID=A0A284S6A1_ARMOS|nr:uncharacterized protein ARMOST_20046 [Armillaria ostoyae]